MPCSAAAFLLWPSKLNGLVTTATVKAPSSLAISAIILVAVFSFLYLFYNLRAGKVEISNKILLKNLLEGLDMELPDELKALDNSSTDPQKLS